MAAAAAGGIAIVAISTSWLVGLWCAEVWICGAFFGGTWETRRKRR